MESKFRKALDLCSWVCGNADSVEFCRVHACEDSNGEHLQRTAFCGICGRAEHGRATGGMDSKQVSTGCGGDTRRGGDGIWNIVQLEVEKDVLAALLQSMDDGRAFCQVEFKADLVPENRVAKLVDEAEGVGGRGNVKGDDELVLRLHGVSVRRYADTDGWWQRQMEEQGTTAATALTIAGFDPSSGAGITADLLTFAAHRVFATAAITALTVQSTRGVFAVELVPPEVLRQTLLRLEEDLPPAGIKIGMLGSADHAAVVADYLAEVRSRRHVEVVLDPVVRSSSGAALLDAAEAWRPVRGLLTWVDVVTPNLAEAAALTGLPCGTREQMVRCAEHLRTDFPLLHVVVTGGHLAECTDLLCGPEGLLWFDGVHLSSRSTHGTGCAFSSALLAEKLQGRSWAEAAKLAKGFVARGIDRATPRGSGHGPLALLPQLERPVQPVTDSAPQPDSPYQSTDSPAQ